MVKSVQVNSILIRILKHIKRDLEEQMKNGGAYESGPQNENETI